MSVFNITQHGTASGGPGDDTLNVTATGNLALFNITGNPAGGYDGHFTTGYAGEGVYFTGIENFGFWDTASINNYIETGAGNDNLNGGGGDDTLIAWAGDNTIDGGAGNDRVGVDLSSRAESFTVNLNTMSTLLSGFISNAEGFIKFYTGSGNDQIAGHQAAFQADEISTGGGNDTITLWHRNDGDTVDAGTGNDRLVVHGEGNLALINITGNPAGGYDGTFSTGYAGEGVYFYGVENFTFIDEVAVANTIYTGVGNDSLSGGGGNDTLIGGAGIDTIDGGAGVDMVGVDLSGRAESFTVDLNTLSTFLGGSIVGGEGFVDFHTGAGNDVISSHMTSFVSDWIDSGSGNDTVTLWHRNAGDTVAMGTGNDRLVVHGYGNLSLGGVTANPTGGYDGSYSTGYAGEGVYFSGVEDFTFIDEVGVANSIQTGAGDDSLAGGGGNDTLLAGAGDNTVDGGDGNDLFGADLSARAESFAIDLNTVSTLLTGTVRNVEGFANLMTGDGADVITGHMTSHMADSVTAGGGDDTIVLWNQAENDNVAGGTGSDRLVVFGDARLGLSIAVNPAGGYDGKFGTGYAGEGVHFSGIEHFSFIDNTDTNSSITTGEGMDYIDGGVGNDTLRSNAGADTLIGGKGNDTLDGGTNPELGSAGAQGDVMLGGEGDDTYYVDSGLDLVDEGIYFAGYGFGGNDTIISTTDFYWDIGSVGETIRVDAAVNDIGGDGVTVVGGVFNNTMVGHDGTDIFFGRGGSDTYFGGNGVDWYSLSLLGTEGAYPGIDGPNEIVVTRRTAGSFSYDIVFEFESGKDKLNVHDYWSVNGLYDGDDVLARAYDDGAGNCYFVLGDGFDYLYMVGVEKADLAAGDFIV